MRIHNVRVILIVILMFQINSGGSFKCYQCRSDVDRGCEEKPSKRYYKECIDIPIDDETTSPSNSGSADSSTDKTEGAPLKTNPFTCRKVVQLLYINETKSLVLRECGRVGVEQEGCKKIANKLLYLNVCDCKMAGCNRSKRAVSVRILLILSFTVAIFHAYY